MFLVNELSILNLTATLSNRQKLSMPPEAIYNRTLKIKKYFVKLQVFLFLCIPGWYTFIR